MIYTVTFNPSLDYIVDVEHFMTGKVNRTVGEKVFAGGKGINVSIVLSNLGHENTALGFIAGFTGDELCRLIEEKGVKADLINVEEGMTRINVKLRSDEESEINGQGPYIGDRAIEKLMQKLDTIKSDDILILSGSIPSTMPDTIYADIMKHLSGRNIKIVVDATNDLLMNVLQYQPFAIKPNNHELGEIFGVKLSSREDVVPYARKLQEKGAKNVIVSMAGEGAVLVAENGKVYATEAPKGVLKNSVGAGDSMVAGFVAGYLESGDFGNAFKYGTCTGSASAFSEELATREEVEELLKNTNFLF